MTIACLVLAAGRSSRLGRPKQLLPFRGRPLLEAVDWAGPTVAWAGALTAVALGAVAVVQSDLKQLLAASTSAQIGFVVLAAVLRRFVLPVALAGGIALQLVFPGEFDYKLHEGGPPLVTWFAVLGGPLLLAFWVWRRPSLERPTWLAGAAAVLFLVPIGVLCNLLPPGF